MSRVRNNITDEEIEQLVIKAKSAIKKEAQDTNEKLLALFHNFLMSFEVMLLYGSINPRSSYQRTFLRIWTNSSVDPKVTLTNLRKRLGLYEPGAKDKDCKEEVKSIITSAFLQSIHTTDSNLVSTFVYKLKDELFALIKDPSHRSLEFREQTVGDKVLNQVPIELQIFISGLPLDEYELVIDIMNGYTKNGNPIEMPEVLKQKFKDSYYKDHPLNKKVKQKEYIAHF